MKELMVKFLLKCYDVLNFKKARIILFKLINRLDDIEHNNLIYIMKKYYYIDIGVYSYGCYKVDGAIEPGTIIGRFCSFAPGVRIGGLNHPVYWVTTHPILYNRNYGFTEDKTIKSKPVVIEDDVWVGFNAIILGGVKIGKGAVIGAGSVVTKDVPPYSIVAGNPAKVIKYRFSSEEISALNDINWCSWNREKIKEEIQYFKRLDLFIQKYNNNSI